MKGVGYQAVPKQEFLSSWSAKSDGKLATDAGQLTQRRQWQMTKMKMKMKVYGDEAQGRIWSGLG